MLSVQALTKVYGETVALDRVSFEVGRGEVVGFLGPNGAGKTTTLRILTGFIPQTGGRAFVDGLDTFTRSLDVRRRIGYLPESAPLYQDLRVIEYLRFRARLKGVPLRGRRRAVDRAVVDCFLEHARKAPIRTLSKGHRQRVGLADALLGRPPLLILDEPTAGLDPNQVRRIRELIRSLGGHHTVLLSTHLLPEVEATCRRAIIIHDGRVASIEDVEARSRGRLSAVDCELIGPGDEIDETLRRLPGVAGVTREQLGGGAHAVRVRTDAGLDLREAIGRAALRAGWVVRELHPTGESLEDLFVRVTTGEDRRQIPVTTTSSLKLAASKLRRMSGEREDAGEVSA